LEICGICISTLRIEGGCGEEGDGKDRGRGRGFGIRRGVWAACKWTIVSLSLPLTSPESITLSISTLFWTSFLSLLIAVLISSFKDFAMVRVFPFLRVFYSRSSPTSSGSLGSPERIAISESSSGSPELRMHLCLVPSLVLASKSPIRLVHGRQGGILISIPASISPYNHT
jgi:hypothetical protein